MTTGITRRGTIYPFTFAAVVIAANLVAAGAPAAARLTTGIRPAEKSPMKMSDIPFGTTQWDHVEPTEHAGTAGVAVWRTRQFGTVRVRMVDYSPGYRADHWCEKGHILLCLEGDLRTELADGRTFVLEPGMSYQVADGAEAHRSSTVNGAKLFIVD